MSEPTYASKATQGWPRVKTDLESRLREAEAERDRLREAIRAYVVAVTRAPNNRDEAEIDAASRGLLEVLEGTSE